MMNSMTYQERLKRYKSRYNYHPPTTYFNHAQRQEICGAAPHHTEYFQKLERVKIRAFMNYFSKAQLALKEAQPLKWVPTQANSCQTLDFLMFVLDGIIC
mmetsp:Transcript_22468/g.33203  ORF Transcript_22468/g.33203 Transcript_22468/m.33203 type:complete len:100 (+) Transcript_22468:151-450(+)